uniref:Uncharacterized protein n=1 Tax=Meloidogyne enterolobii TaxID=390850 RepID=A0A6V7UE39_MELEN|nr:unnamed protein product [Meloidogyne enterolobii]
MTQNTCQSYINNFFSKNQCPKKVIEEQKCLFARFMARPTIPISIVENQEFRDLLKNYDPRYKIPSRCSVDSILMPKAAAILEDIKISSCRRKF